MHGIVDSVIATYLISQENNLYLKILSPYEPKAFMVILAGAVRKSDISLANAINQQINEMKER